MPLSIGDEAPNFDLTSTEDVLLMLVDEVPRTPVVLYFFHKDQEEIQADLVALARRADAIQRIGAKILAVSSAKLDLLKDLQRNLKLPFALLHDDRDFARYYGVSAAAEDTAQSALVVVDRRQKVLWIESPVRSVATALPEVEKVLAETPSPTSNYPRKVINRIVDWWVN